jgi:hypothetical protein
MFIRGEEICFLLFNRTRKPDQSYLCASAQSVFLNHLPLFIHDADGISNNWNVHKRNKNL